MEGERTDYQGVIDDALRIVYSHHHRLVSQLFPMPSARSTWRLAKWSSGTGSPSSAQFARGEVREPKDRVLEAIDSVLQLRRSGHRWPRTTQCRGLLGDTAGGCCRWRSIVRTNHPSWCRLAPLHSVRCDLSDHLSLDG